MSPERAAATATGAAAPAASLPDIVRIVRDGKEVAFRVVNKLTAWRAQTVMQKEPGTVAWIEEFAPGDVLVDVGANVGVYSLCAARFRGARVFAFEPESQNYAVLNENIYRNGLHDSVTAYCVALSDETGYRPLYLSEFQAGSSCHNLGEPLNPDRVPMAVVAFRQGSCVTTLDRLVAEGVVPPPQHVKIDVDGIEHKVVRGAARTLADARVKSALVEVNTKLDEHWGIVDFMLERGFRYSEEEADRARRKDGPFAGTGNYVFRR
jgi:FkbM family methyltransferase